jgi:CheY-like chemotaxis protein
MKKFRNKAAAKKQPVKILGSNRSVPTVLHIDDDPNDTELFQAAASRAKVRFAIQNVSDGEQAMAYLNGRGVHSDRTRYPLPVLILLDLKMPRATGFDVLKWIRKHPEVGNLPIVILSGSELRDDIQQAYAVGADSYLVKPIGFNALVALVTNIEKSWIAGQSSQSPRSPLLTGSASQHSWSSHPEWFGDGTGAEARA